MKKIPQSYIDSIHGQLPGAKILYPGDLIFPFKIECYEPNAISALSQMYGYPDDTAGLARVVLDCGDCDSNDEQQDLLNRAGLLGEYMRLMDEDGDNIPDIGDYLVKAIRILEDKNKTRYTEEE